MMPRRDLLVVFVCLWWCPYGEVVLPVVDLSAEDAQDLLGSALSDIGATVVVGDGVEDLGGVLEATRSVFYEKTRNGSFIGRGGESGGSGLVEAKEGFAFEAGSPSNDDRLERAFGQLQKAARRVVALSGLEGCCSKDAEASALLRLFRYFPSDLGLERDVVGSAPHTDWGLLTFVVADAPGLEIFHENQWQPVAFHGPSLLLHAGDFMAMTKAAVRSPRHRVLVAPDRERFSLVFFYYPDSDAPVPANHHSQEGLSLLQCQAADPTTCQGPTPPTFGELIKQKWQEVRR